MKSTCPRCGTKDNHEKIVSTIRTWFRCTECSFVWRGSLLSMAYSSAPVGTVYPTPKEEDPSHVSQLEPTVGVTRDELVRQLDDADDAVERRTSRPAQGGHPASMAQDPGEADTSRTNPNVDAWLDAAEAAVPVRKPVSVVDPIEAMEPGVEARPTQPQPGTKDLDEWFSTVDASAGADRRPTEPVVGAEAPSDPWLVETSSDAPQTRTDSWLNDLAASEPPTDASTPEAVSELAPLPAPGNATVNGAGLDAAVETRASLGEMMRRLDSFYSGLVQMERRLDTSGGSYAQVTDRWQPVTLDMEPRKTARSRQATGC